MRDFIELIENKKRLKKYSLEDTIKILTFSIVISFLISVIMITIYIISFNSGFKLGYSSRGLDDSLIRINKIIDKANERNIINKE